MADEVIVFAGPTLPPGVFELPEGFAFRPPARRGDIYRALQSRPRMLVLIDGEFHGSPTVWHRELLDAIGEGVVVIGASSMGALRAAELHTLGMIGCGRIFEAYRDGALNDDDEVALVYGPAHLGYPALSEPMVNLRATLALARSSGVIDVEQELQAVGHAKAAHYPNRTHAAVLAAPPFADNSALQQRYGAFVATRAVDQKRVDGLAALRLAAAGHAVRPTLAGPSSADADWAPARAAMELGAASLPAARTLLELAGRDPAEEQRWWEELSWRWFARQWLRDAGMPPLAQPLPDAEPPSGSRLTSGAYARLLHDVAEAEKALSLAGGARHRVVADWARRRGLAPSQHEEEALRRRHRPVADPSLDERPAALADRVLAEWAVSRGPGHFGYRSWSFETALLRELQRLGLAAPIFARAGS